MKNKHKFIKRLKYTIIFLCSVIYLALLIPVSYSNIKEGKRVEKKQYYQKLIEFVKTKTDTEEIITIQSTNLPTYLTVLEKGIIRQPYHHLVSFCRSDSSIGKVYINAQEGFRIIYITL